MDVSEYKSKKKIKKIFFSYNISKVSKYMKKWKMTRLKLHLYNEMMRQWAKGRVRFYKDPLAWIKRMWEYYEWQVLHDWSVTAWLFKLKNKQELTNELDEYNRKMLDELDALMKPGGIEAAFKPGKAFVTFEWA